MQRMHIDERRSVFNYMLKPPLHIPLQHPKFQHHEKVNFHGALCCESTKTFSNLHNIHHIPSSNNNSRHTIFLVIEEVVIFVVRYKKIQGDSR